MEEGQSYREWHSRVKAIGTTLRRNKRRLQKVLPEMRSELEQLLLDTRMSSVDVEATSLASSRRHEAVLWYQKAMLEKMSGRCRHEAMCLERASGIWLDVERERMSLNIGISGEALWRGVLCGLLACGTLILGDPLYGSNQKATQLRTEVDGSMIATDSTSAIEKQRIVPPAAVCISPETTKPPEKEQSKPREVFSAIAGRFSLLKSKAEKKLQEIKADATKPSVHRDPLEQSTSASGTIKAPTPDAAPIASLDYLPRNDKAHHRFRYSARVWGILEHLAQSLRQSGCIVVASELHEVAAEFCVDNDEVIAGSHLLRRALQRSGSGVGGTPSVSTRSFGGPQNGSFGIGRAAPKISEAAVESTPAHRPPSVANSNAVVTNARCEIDQELPITVCMEVVGEAMCRRLSPSYCHMFISSTAQCVALCGLMQQYGRAQLLSKDALHLIQPFLTNEQTAATTVVPAKHEIERWRLTDADALDVLAIAVIALITQLAEKQALEEITSSIEGTFETLKPILQRYDLWRVKGLLLRNALEVVAQSEILRSGRLVVNDLTQQCAKWATDSPDVSSQHSSVQNACFVQVSAKRIRSILLDELLCGERSSVDREAISILINRLVDAYS